MLDCERWTLTHSSGWADVLVELGLALAFGLALGLALWPGLAAKWAASEAEAVAEAEVWDDDGEADGEPADPVGDPEGDVDGEFDLEAEPDGEGDAGLLLGLSLGVVVAGGELEAPEAETDGVGVGVGVGVFDGFGVGFGVGVGVGVGDGVLEAGSTWQTVSVFALAEAAASRSELACAVPGRPASTPRVRKPPPSTLSAVTRTCARRIRIALSPLRIGVAVCSSWVRRQLGDGWVSILISGVGGSYACTRTPDRGRAAWRVGSPAM